VSANHLFPGFSSGVANAGAIQIPYVMAGSGPPLLLLHGYPQTHVIWHKVALALAQNFTVVASDLRGYGDASKFAGLPDHSNYSKREMANDQVALMQQLGFERFSLVGHDRGGRVGHRLAMDHPRAVEKMMLLDISPTLTMYDQTTREFASAYWHWFFLIQPAPLPERLIGADPEFFLREFMGKRSAGMRPFTTEAWAEYLRAMSDPACVHAMCEDYRAAASIDLQHDCIDRDAGNKLACPLRVLWGIQSVIEKCFEPIEDWSGVAETVSGRELDCGHYIPEEAPEALLAEIEQFFKIGKHGNA
jgi:haloacetate dehalogenase